MAAARLTFGTQYCEYLCFFKEKETGTLKCRNSRVWIAHSCPSGSSVILKVRSTTCEILRFIQCSNVHHPTLHEYLAF